MFEDAMMSSCVRYSIVESAAKADFADASDCWIAPPMLGCAWTVTFDQQAPAK